MSAFVDTRDDSSTHCNLPSCKRDPPPVREALLCFSPSRLLAERTVEAAVLLPLPQLGEQRPGASSAPRLQLGAGRGLSVRARLRMLEVHVVIGDLVVDGQVGSVRGEVDKVARRRSGDREGLHRFHSPPRVRGDPEARVGVAAGGAPVGAPLLSDRSLPGEERSPLALRVQAAGNSLHRVQLPASTPHVDRGLLLRPRWSDVWVTRRFTSRCGRKRRR